MPAKPTLPECIGVWASIGALSFGGPAGQIALMQRTLVDDKQWIAPAQFSSGLNFAMLLPGPEAQQLATYCGWLLHGVRGALWAGALFVLPGALVMLGLSFLYVTVGQSPMAAGVMLGVKAVVLVIVLDALRRLAARALKRPSDMAIAALAFVALAAFQVPFPLVILAAGLAGALRAHDLEAEVLGQALPPGQLSRSARIAAIGIAAWLAPLALVLGVLGPQSVFASLSLFFSKMAVVTFGGAYAVLSYVAQQAVDHYRWLSPAEMTDGLGLAETTPGPLILVVQHVGFLAGWRAPGLLSPAAGAVLAAALTSWATFVPSFVLILLGAPYIAQIAARPRLAGALAGITAAVLGVILNMALWFGLHVLFGAVRTQSWAGGTVQLPELATFQLVPLGIAAVAAGLLMRKLPVPAVVLCGAALGLGAQVLG